MGFNALLKPNEGLLMLLILTNVIGNDDHKGKLVG
jgi:hypothetical protein